MIPTYEQMGDWLEEIAGEFPDAFFEELDGGIQLEEAAPVEELSPLDLFAQFYRQQNSQPMTQAQTDFVRDLIETIWEEDAP